MMMRRHRLSLVGFTVIILIGVSFYRHWKKNAQESFIRRLQSQGSIKVLTLNSPTTYYEKRKGHFAGFEHDLVSEFAHSIGVKPQFKVYYSISRLMEALEKEEVAFAAAGLNPTPKRREKFIFGPGYQDIRQQVVCHKRTLPSSLEELASYELNVTANSSYEESLASLNELGSTLTWKADENRSTENLLYATWKARSGCVVADSNIVDINRRYFPELKVAFDLPGEQKKLSWIFPPNAHRLRGLAQTWFEEFESTGALADLEHHYYGFIREFDYYDTKVFHRRLRVRLPRYMKLFRAVERKHDLPWTLVAAMAYQESQWNPRAVSPTGVRGLMMLTRITAREMGVNNRLDPKQSIFGGARYYKRLIKRVSSDIEGRQRNWFALAAYNVGYGHLKDAQTLAVRLNKNPDSWLDMKTVLPLLSNKKYYRTLRYGYARGMEPVRYVERIRHYRDLLEKVSRNPI